MKLFPNAGSSNDRSLQNCQRQRAGSECELTLQHLYKIQERLQSDLTACDARLSMFVAAANSYRFETLLQPCPTQFLDCNGRPNIDGILDVIADIESLEAILKQLMKGNYNCCPHHVLTLLHAVLVKHGARVSLSTLPAYKFQDLYKHLGITAPQKTPTHIFEVAPSAQCAHTEAYASLRQQYPVHIAYYAGKLAHLYVMLTEGTMPQDTPLELICSLDEAVQQSPCNAGWGSSVCGALVSCVAVVEFVLTPSMVELSKDNKRVLIMDSNCMQISFLMFFGQSFTEYESQLTRPRLRINIQETTRWLRKNKYAISLGVYLMMLSLTSRSGSGVLHKLATTGLFVLRKSIFQI